MRTALLAISALFLFTGCEFTTVPQLVPEAAGLEPLPAPANIDPAVAAVGRLIYHDEGLSKSGTISCATCHSLETFGADVGNPTSTGEGPGARNTPTSFNAAMQRRQLWHGKFASVEDHALGPVLQENEHGLTESEALDRVKSAELYQDAWTKAWPDDGKSLVRMRIAIGAFERTLVTPAPIDAYLSGNPNALDESAVRGLQSFVRLGCRSCHDGALFGGSQLRKLGAAQPWTRDDDNGLEGLTGNAADRQVFKVPQLRNVAETKPYFHLGNVETLDEAIQLMGRHQLGIEIEDAERADIAAFLGSMTGQLP